MTLRDGPPLSRELAHDELEHRTVVGAQPWSVDYGQAAGLTRAYAERVNTLVDQMQSAINSWAREIVEQHRAMTDDEQAFLFRDWTLFHANWESNYVQINSPFFGVVGLTPFSTEEAWQKTEALEEQLHKLRATFAEFTATSSVVKAPPDPGSLETPGGQPTPGLLSDVGAGIGHVVSALPFGTIALAIGLGIGAVLLAPRVLGR